MEIPKYHVEHLHNLEPVSMLKAATDSGYLNKGIFVN
jgi:hypothetical protein